MRNLIITIVMACASLGLLAGVIAPAASAAPARPAASALAAKPALTPAQRAALQKWVSKAEQVLSLEYEFQALLREVKSYLTKAEYAFDNTWIGEEITALKADIAEANAEIKDGIITAPSLPNLKLPPPTQANPKGGGCTAPPPFVCIT